MKTHQILVTIKTTKDIKDLVDHVAGRAYTMDGVSDVTASLFSNTSIIDLESETVRQQLRDAGWREPVKPPSGVEFKIGRSSAIYRAVYVGTAEYAEYMRARFPDRGARYTSFEFDGHRWAYRHTGLDDNGDYHLLWRPGEYVEQDSEEVSPPKEQFEVAGVVVNRPTFWGGDKLEARLLDGVPAGSQLYIKV